ncbi:MAG: alpha/beta fold hydrolase [Gammaproteobacteria bacterium]|nr:alpha/beta fold hydrolase [Gammaproteobacteria bacterium]
MTTALLVTLAAAIAALLLLRFLNPGLLARGLLVSTRRLLGFRTRLVQVDGSAWPYLEGGPASAEAVVLVHGFGGDKDNWPLYGWRLAREFRVIVPDLPGFGDNRKDPDADYGGAAQAERLLRFIDALKLERIHLGGNSMGGLIALHFALAYPQRMLSLALLDNAGVRGSQRSELELAAGRGESPLTVSTAAEFDALLSFVTHRRLPLPGVIKQALAENAIAQREFWDSIFWSLREELERQPLNEQLVNIDAPTLVMWGRHDRLIDVSCCDVLAAGLPNCECLVFEDVGHVPMLERPGQSSAAHLAHLRRNAAATF